MASGHDPVALRLQGLELQVQTLVLAALAADRADASIVTPAAVGQLFEDFALPAPVKISNVFASLRTKKLLAAVSGRGSYKVTPLGRATVAEKLSGLDLVALVAEGASENAPVLGQTELSLVPYTLAPPALVQPLRGFLADHPFDTNVFGMTRFPDAKAGTKDPVGRALAVAKDVCAEFGLEFHLASDRAITDDLWSNVTAHMWGCRYGIGFFEDRLERGLNHNLLIEVGAMIMTGRRCALLRDGSIDKMPTDFIGMIYKSVNLEDESTVRDRVTDWLKDDLRVGKL
ncbi:hypothetical protein ACFVU2_02925 [Leifsonia sp. NPDC058194]|uniref:hypothetical protein n=1 Tax=Leifsonia sp. NPDC058194 TaxID=3346374 RepID=UPI0036D9241D